MDTMNKFDRFIQQAKKAFLLPEKIAYLVAAPLFVLLVIGFAVGGPIKYFSYPLSTYALIITIIALTKTVPRIGNMIVNSFLWKYLEEMPIIGALFTDKVIRMRFFLYLGAGMNIFYVVLKISTGIIYSSLWLSFFGGYYLALAILRLFIIHCERKYEENADLVAEYRRYRACGIILLFLNVILSFIVRLAIAFKASMEYPGVLIYGMGVYAFYSVILALVNIYRNKKKERPMFNAARIASFTSALVAMLSLEIAMTARFGATDYEFRKNMTTWTGVVVCGLILYMAILMIIRGNMYLSKVERREKSYVKHS